MAGAERGRRAGGLAVAVLVMAAALPRPALADEAYGAQRLPGLTVAAISVDLDGDGTGEVLRIRAVGSTTFELEAWTETDGTWSRAAEQTVVTPLPDAETGADPIVSLLRWQVNGRASALLVTAALERQVSDVSASTCCVSLARVELVGGRLEVEPLDAAIGADFIQLADLDADGTDELVTQLSTYPSANEYAVEFAFHRWTGSRFETVFDAPPDTQGLSVVTGDADGEPGDEVYVTRGNHVDRVVMVDGAIQFSEAGLDFDPTSGGWIAGVANDRVVIQDGTSLAVLRWPAGADPVEVARVTDRDYPQVTVIGSGGSGLIVFFQGGYGGGTDALRTSVYDMDLNRLGDAKVDTPVGDVWVVVNEVSYGGGGLSRNLFGYSGPIPGPSADGGSASFMGGGMLIEPRGPGEFSVAAASVLVSSFPLALTGADDGWLMLGDGTFTSNASGSSTYLYPFGGPYGPATSTLTLVPLDEALRPVSDALASVELRGAVEVTAAGGTRILAPRDGFEALVSAPPGTVVIVQDGGQSREFEVGDVPEIIGVRRGGIGRDGADMDFERQMLVLAPDGRASVIQLQGTFVAEPPDLIAYSHVGVFELQARIRGRPSRNASVSVDGQPVALDGSGAFDVAVDAPIWPRDVVIVARDPLGNETTERLQIVGFLDYRGLPWAAILGVATVGAALVLFVRTPRRRPESSLRWDDAILEEVDGDPS
jgi:hypothetical protein